MIRIGSVSPPMDDARFNSLMGLVTRWHGPYFSFTITHVGPARTLSPVLCLSHETHEVEGDYPGLVAFVAGWRQQIAQATEQIDPERARQLTGRLESALPT